MIFFKKKRYPITSEFLTAAKDLERLLNKYATTEPEAQTCLTVLQPLIDDVISGKAKLPNKVPCSYHFHEGGLRKYKDLESAYSSFAVRVKGYDLERAKKFI